VGLCPDGTFSWGFVQPAPTRFDPDLRNVRATIVFDGHTLVDGAANFPFPAPFIRVDVEK
jgi:hypothetical protein